MSCASARSASCSSPAPDRACRARSTCLQGGAAPWVRQAEAEAGTRKDRLTAEERDRLEALERENREPNGIFKAASVYFAMELDGAPRR